MQFNVKTNGAFGAHLQRRIEAWHGRKIGARIRVPPELSWWYWQEFGTATRGDQPQASGHTYPIYPVNAKMLSWPGASGQRVFSHGVPAHPGIPPRRSVTKVLDDIRQETQEGVRAALREGGADHPDLIHSA